MTNHQLPSDDRIALRDPSPSAPSKRSIESIKDVDSEDSGSSSANSTKEQRELKELSYPELLSWVESTMGVLDEEPNVDERETDTMEEETLSSAWGSALGIAIIDPNISDEHRDSIIDNTSSELGGVYHLEDITGSPNTLAFIQDVGTHQYGVDPVDDNRMVNWIESLLDLMSRHKDMGLTLLIGRGFLSSSGPKGPILDGVTDRVLTIPGLLLATPTIRERLLSFTETTCINALLAPVRFSEGNELCRLSKVVASKSTGTPKFNRRLVALDTTSMALDSLESLMNKAPSGNPQDDYASHRSGLTREYRKVISGGNKAPGVGELLVEIDVNQVQHSPYRQCSTSLADFPQSLKDSSDVSTSKPSQLLIGDYLDVSIRRRGDTYVYLLTQSNFGLTLLKVIPPTSEEPHRIQTSDRIELIDSATYYRSIIINSNNMLLDIDTAMALLDQGPTRSPEQSLEALTQTIASLNAHRVFSVTTTPTIRVLAPLDAPEHPLARQLKSDLRNWFSQDVVDKIDAELSGDVLNHHRAGLLGMKGSILRRLRHHSEAKSALIQSVELAKLCLAPKAHVDALNDLARSFTDLGEVDEALSFTEEATSLSIQSEYHSGQALACFHKAVALFVGAFYEEALEAYREVEALAIKYDENRYLSASLHGQGSLLSLLGRLEEAQPPLEAAIQSYQREGERLSLINATADLADVYRRQGKSTQALFQFRTALYLIEMEDSIIPKEHLGIYRARFARCLGDLNRPQEAKVELLGACAILREIGSNRLPDALVHLAKVSLESGDLELAQSALTEMEASGPNLAVDVRWMSALTTGLLQERLGGPSSLSRAEASYLTGFEALESMRDRLSLSHRSAYLDSSQALWNALISLKVKQGGHPVSLLKAIERVRARWFQDALIAQHPTAALRRQEASQSYPWDESEVEQALGIIPENIGLLEAYCLPNELIYIWIKGGKAKVRRVNISWADLDALATKVVNMLSERPTGPEFGHGLLREASTVLLGPCSDWLRTLEDGQPLGLLLHGPLHKVPFHALPSPLETHDLTPITLRNPVFYSPSLRSLWYWLSRDTVNETGTFLAMGDPKGDIPNARLEVTQLADAMTSQGGTPQGVTSLVGEEATVAALFEHAESASILHLATHGRARTGDKPACLMLAPPRAPRALALADGRNEPEPLDGQLSLELVSMLDHRARLVVLSACESGKGDVRPSGEGLELLSRAFLVGGAQRVISSVWPAHDGATRVLMDMFYRHLLAGRSIVDALSKAQGELHRCAHNTEGSSQDYYIPSTWAHPHYWAAFSLTGDPT